LRRYISLAGLLIGAIISAINNPLRSSIWLPNSLSRGRGVAVVQSLDDYEDHEEEREFMKAVTKGILEAKEGKSIGLRDVKRKLGIK